LSILLIRHGETALNAARVLQPADTPLSERGSAQARSLARRLAGLELAGIVSSDLPRALQTAAPIAAATGHAVRADPLLQERNFGDLRGRAYDTLGFDPLATDEAPPGGESVEQFRRRVALAFDAVIAMRAALGGPLAVVTHGLVIRTILQEHVRLPARFDVPERLANTSLTILAETAPHQVLLLNCAAHLEAGERDDARSLAGF
jgi:probable phosphoglycerate mutase